MGEVSRLKITFLATWPLADHQAADSSRQIACADVIILNKVADVDAAQVTEVTDLIQYVLLLCWFKGGCARLTAPLGLQEHQRFCADPPDDPIRD
jgi:hypothetical protein